MTVILFILIILIACIRFIPGAGELYATLLYPHISATLSWLSSWVPFSLDEVVALIGIFLLIMTLVTGIKRSWKWQKTVWRMVRLLLWYGVWFYLGWGCNYFRDDFYVRMGIVPAKADKEVFMRFADDFSEKINDAWESKEKKDGFLKKSGTEKQEETEAEESWKKGIVTEIKKLYHYLPPTANLCQPKDYQQPKEMLLNGLYSASGVLGFMGPWMGENLLNQQLLPVQFPSIFAHEYSHLLGVNNEAEANYWAYFVCTKSTDPEIRYSGYQCLLPYVLSNAFSMLDEEAYRAYLSKIRPEIIQERREISAHWEAQRIAFVDELQNVLLDLQLKSNNIPSGTSNYNQVVGMIISMQENAKK